MLLVLALAFTGLFAQGPIAEGEKQVNFGTGFSTWGIPFYVGMDFGVHPDISVGFNLSYRSFNSTWVSEDYRLSVIGIFGNGNYHFSRILNIPEPWDFYAGLSLGFVSVSTPSDYDGGTASGVGIDGQVGARYYWSDRWAVNLEFGGGNATSGGRIGLTYKL